MINITREQFFDFVKTEKDTDDVISKPTKHYLDYFDKYQSAGKKGNWNWAAFFGNAYWMACRRMYLAACAVASVSFLFSQIIEKLVGLATLMQLILSVSLSLILYCIVGYFSDYMYLHYASTKILKGKIHSGINRKLKFVFWGLFVLALIASFIAGLIIGGTVFKTPS